MAAIGGDGSAGSGRVAGRWFAVALWAVLCVGLVAQYRGVMRIQPASDDFAALAEIQRGQDLGVAAFFTRPSQSKHYRPVQSIGTWAAGSLARSPDERVVWIHALTLASGAVYLGVVLLWGRAMGLSRLGLAVAGVVATLHPVLPAQLASLDTWSSVLAPAAVWLGAWVLMKGRDRLALAMAAVLPMFAAAALMKEYAYALAPLGAWTVLWFGRAPGAKGSGERSVRRRVVEAVIVGAVLTAVVAGIMWSRRYTAPEDAARYAAAAAAAGGERGGVPVPSLSPLHLPANLALYGAALLTPLNSVWVYSHRAAVGTLLAAGAGAAGCAALLGIGVWVRVRGERRGSRQIEGRWGGAAGWVVYLGVGFLAATFPNNVLPKVSEVYAAAPLLVLALLAGLAAEGWSRLGVVWRGAALAAGVALAAGSVWINEQKVAAVRRCGESAAEQMRQVLSFVPPEQIGWRIGVVFLRGQIEPRRLYSVYVMDDDVPLDDPRALEWERPHRRLRLERLLVDDASEVDVRGYDLCLLWDARSQRFAPMAPARP